MAIPSKALERRRARDRRREEAAALREEGRSTRQIADVLGVSTFTVRDDLRAMNAWEPVIVHGTDNKVYPANAAEREKRRAEKRKAEQDKAEQEIVLEPVVERCAYCNFVAVGEVEEAHRAFVEHLRSATTHHPPPPAKSARSRPRGRGYRTRK